MGEKKLMANRGGNTRSNKRERQQRKEEHRARKRKGKAERGTK